MAFNRVEKVADLITPRRALVSVHDKTGLPELVAGLARLLPGIELYSTGGTHAALAAIIASLDPSCVPPRLVAVSDYTGQPEMSGGLVKTLDWKIYLGLLSESGNAAHEADLVRTGALPFDLVIANLYPFESASLDPRSSPEDLRQRIDIGGPAMLRASAKNFLRVATLASPDLYGSFLEELAAMNGRSSLDWRLRAAAIAFKRVSRFDEAISSKLASLDLAALAACYEIEAEALR